MISCAKVTFPFGISHHIPLSRINGKAYSESLYRDRYYRRYKEQVLKNQIKHRFQISNSKRIPTDDAGHVSINDKYDV